MNSVVTALRIWHQKAMEEARHRAKIVKLDTLLGGWISECVNKNLGIWFQL